MNWLDIVLVVVLAWSAFRSFRRGFAREIIGLGAAFLALMLGMWFYGMASVLVLPYVNSQQVANLFGFFLVVAAVLILGALVGWIVSRFIRTIGLSVFDRLLGAAFGLARGLLLAIALLTAFMAFGPHEARDSAPSAVLNSRIAPYVIQASRAFVALAPMDLKQSFQTRYASIQASLKSKLKTGGDADEADERKPQ